MLLYMLERVKGSSHHAGADADGRLDGASCGAVNKRTGCLSFIPRPVPVCGRPGLGRAFPALRDVYMCRFISKGMRLDFFLLSFAPL